LGVFGKIVDKFRNKNNEEKKYLKIAKEHIDKAGENLTKEQINEMMKLGMDTRELYPEVSKLYFERIEDYFPHASTMLATFYMDKDDEMYEKYCLKAANQGENIAKKSLAIFYAKNNNEEKMLEWYNKLDDKEDYDVLAYMSNYYMFQDNYDKVKEINFTILKNKKDDKYAPNCLGDAYFVEGDFENSEKYYKMALENGSPDSKDKLFNLYQTTENIEKFRELIEKDEAKRGEDFLSLGNLYFHKKDYKMAEKWYLESEKLGFLEAKYNLGYVYYEIGNFEKAEKYFQEVIEKVPHLKESAIEKLINVPGAEAWVHGPVFRDLYTDFRYNDYFYTNQANIEEISEETSNFLERIWNVYGSFSGEQLEEMTHNEAPWINARKGLDKFESSNNLINDADIFEEYLSR